MKKFLLISLIIYCNFTIAQISESNYFFAKEFSKDISLYKAKEFVIENILKESNSIIRFELDPLAATTSGEITSLVYKCSDRNVEGLILGFYGNYWNDAGVIYQGYAFKNLPKVAALELLDKISKAIEDQKIYLNKDLDNNNIYFQYEDLTILIYKSTDFKMRVFWREFDAEWTFVAFSRTKRRFERSIK